MEEGDFTETRSSRQQSSFDVDNNERSVDAVPSNISSYNPNDFAFCYYHGQFIVYTYLPINQVQEVIQTIQKEIINSIQNK